jgi:hypothetical protein
MERRAPWFRLVALVLAVAGLLALAAPTPAPAMDPQLIMALASAAGAIALIAGFLIVANMREKQRGASLEGIYACSDQEAAGPMGCGGPAPAGFGVAATFAAASEASLALPERPAASTGAVGGAGLPCPAGQPAGPMGCGVPEPVYSGAAATPTLSPLPQGQ